MINKFNTIILFVLFLVCNSCKDANIKFDLVYDNSVRVIDVEDWKTVKTLKPVPISQVSQELYDPWHINVAGNYLTIRERDGETDFLKFFSLENYSFLKSIGTRGEGPDEFTSVPTLLHNDPKDQPRLTLLDWGRSLLHRVELPELLYNNVWPPASSYLMPPELFLAQRAVFIPEDSTLIGFGGVNDGKLFKYDLATDSILRFTPFYPEFNMNKSNFHESHRGYLYSGEMVVNQVAKKIAVISNYFGQIEIYDYVLNLLSVTRLVEEPYVQTIHKQGGLLRFIRSNSERINYYQDLDFNDEHIFVLYGYRTSGKEKCVNKAELHVFNWEGVPMHRYLLEDCPNRIVYDQNNNRIIGIFPHFEDWNSIIQYYQL
jgi:hypothetical protein